MWMLFNFLCFCANLKKKEERDFSESHRIRIIDAHEAEKGKITIFYSFNLTDLWLNT